MKQTAERPQRKAFRDKYLAVLLALVAFFFADIAQAQDSTKYAPINGYGFKYKRHAVDSVQLIPLVTSTHTPYRPGGIKYDPDDSTHILVWTGFQWLEVGDNGTGIDTAYYEEPDLVIVAGEDTIRADLQALGSVDSVSVYKHAGTDSVFTKVNNTETFSFIDNNNAPTSHTFNTVTGVFATQRSGLTDISVDLDGRYVETLIKRDDSVFVTKNGEETFAYIDGGISITNATGSGDTLLTADNEIKRINSDATITRSTNGNQVLLGVDTISHVATKHDLTQVAPTLDVGTINSQPLSSKGAVKDGDSLNFQFATTGFPGLVSADTQTISGKKTFDSIPVIPTASLLDSSTKSASTEFVWKNSLVKGSSLLWPNHYSYNAYPLVIGPGTNRKAIEIINIGYTGHGATDSIHYNPTGMIRINGRLDIARNVQWDSANAKWLTPYKHASAYGSSLVELGGEAVILHATPAGVDFTDVPHEILLASAHGPDGVSGYATDYIVQSKAPLYLRYSSAAYNPATTNNSWNPTTNAHPMVHLHAEQQKDAKNEFLRLEMNHANAGAGLVFKKSNGSYASKTAASTGTVTGHIDFDAYAGSSYETTASIDAVTRGTVGSGVARQSMRFRIGTVNTNTLATAFEMDSAIYVYNRPLRGSYTNTISTIPSFRGTVPLVTSATAWALQAASTVNGGSILQGYTIPGQDTATAVHIRGIQGASSPTRANILFQATKHDGIDSLTSLAATEQAFQFRNNATNLVMIMGNGNMFLNSTGGTNVYPRKLYVNGSIGVPIDSIPTIATTSTDYNLVIDGSDDRIKKRARPKVYTATLSQSGTADPTATVLGDNTIGSIVWTRNETGNYTGTLSSAFTANKTWLSAYSATLGKVTASLSRVDADTVTLIVYGEESGSVIPEDEFDNVSIEIRVYP